MKSHSTAIDPTTFRRRLGLASLMFLSIGLLAAWQAAAAAESGTPMVTGKCEQAPQASQPAPPTNTSAALERLVALHRSATWSSAAPPLPSSGH